MSDITPEEFSSKPFDYLIVGGGTAGLVLAARLTENPIIHVGVLEAGKAQFDNPKVKIPGLLGSSIGDPELDWAYMTTPQKEIGGKQILYSRGKMLGGSSGLNFMFWGRGDKRDYEWEKDFGMKGWTWDNFLKYSKKTQTFNVPTKTEQLAMLPTPTHVPEFHGTDGPIHVSFSSWYEDIMKLPMLAFAAIGVPRNVEPMSGSNVGSGIAAHSIDPATSTRSYAANAYYKPNFSRENLVVLTSAQATKVLIEDCVAVGVEYLFDGKTHTAHASKEVILSAGAVVSPQLLELSGIGDKKLLEKYGIVCKVDNPNVGEGMQDHVMTSIGFELHPGTRSMDDLLDPQKLAEAMKEYEASFSGILATSHTHYAMIPLSKVMPESEVEDIKQIIQKDLETATNPRDRLIYQVELNRLNSPKDSLGQVEIIPAPFGFRVHQTGQAIPGKQYFCFSMVGLYPHSSGSIHISSPNVTDHPAIDPKIYASHVDRHVLLRATQLADRISKTPAFEKFLAKRIQPPEGEMSESDWNKFVEESTGTCFHNIATCAMLPRDKGGVVDEKLKVYGVKGLRVVDASVLPVHISHHIQATVYAVAEQAADLIKEEW
ncbi:alcohol oxidase [Choiromyces venosus 120613-1]|uniref:Alcohol oxidase n=1 Tax=Choiromyces venosus 120613-1 TaxID=1336337 RepID=A0A3N4JJ43_9PEZI|nr:alcohol oxidase [Choiromyces venosus 120613-1]